MTMNLQLKQLGVKKSFRRYLIVSLLSLAFLFVVITHAVAEDANKPSPNPQATSSPNPQNGITTISKGKITNIDITAEQSSLKVQSENSPPVTISVKDPKLKAILLDYLTYSNGDLGNLLVNLDYDNTTKEITSLSVATATIRKGTITNIAITPDQSSLEVQREKSPPVTLSVKDPKLKAILLDFSNGDLYSKRLKT